MRRTCLTNVSYWGQLALTANTIRYLSMTNPANSQVTERSQYRAPSRAASPPSGSSMRRSEFGRFGASRVILRSFCGLSPLLSSATLVRHLHATLSAPPARPSRKLRWSICRICSRATVALRGGRRQQMVWSTDTALTWQNAWIGYILTLCGYAVSGIESSIHCDRYCFHLSRVGRHCPTHAEGFQVPCLELKRTGAFIHDGYSNGIPPPLSSARFVIASPFVRGTHLYLGPCA